MEAQGIIFVVFFEESHPPQEFLDFNALVGWAGTARVVRRYAIQHFRETIGKVKDTSQYGAWNRVCSYLGKASWAWTSRLRRKKKLTAILVWTTSPQQSCPNKEKTPTACKGNRNSKPWHMPVIAMTPEASFPHVPRQHSTEAKVQQKTTETFLGSCSPESEQDYGKWTKNRKACKEWQTPPPSHTFE